jgi:[acyl-carrier-protein] S-malonyltransferase
MTAFLFSGQLSEFSGMGKDFYDSSPDARRLFDLASEKSGADLASAIFRGTQEQWRDNRIAQPAVFVVSVIAARELARRGVVAAAMAGYSLGNYAALVCAGAVSFDDALTVLLNVLEESDWLEIRGAMGAVIGVAASAVEEDCARLRLEGLPVWIGNINAATQLVLTGTQAGVDAALSALSGRALKTLRLPMTWPIHSPLMEPVCVRIASAVSRLGSVRRPEIPFYAGPGGARIGTREEVSELLRRQVALPSRWKETVEAMYADGNVDFLEVGPGETLSKMIRWIVRDASCRPAGTLELIEDIARKG